MPWCACWETGLQLPLLIVCVQQQRTPRKRSPETLSLVGEEICSRTSLASASRRVLHFEGSEPPFNYTSCDNMDWLSHEYTYSRGTLCCEAQYVNSMISIVIDSAGLPTVSEEGRQYYSTSLVILVAPRS